MTSKVNPYFNFHDHGGEQSVHENLVIELIQMYGQTFYYVPRDTPNLDSFFGEDPSSQFTTVTEIEGLITNTDSFDGDGDFLGKFGIEIRNQATIVLSRARFEEELLATYKRPREGDLLYFPRTLSMFEITYVADETMFYHRGRLYAYQLTVERFEYSHEEFETGYSEIDSLEDELSYAIKLTMGAGSGDYTVNEWIYQGASLGAATAKAQVISWETPDLIIKNIHGSFTAATATVGDDSGASYTLTSFDPSENENDSLEDNVEIETEADSVLDFSETDPFSEDY